MSSYKNEYGAWPKSTAEFESIAENRKIVERMYQNGFVSWDIASISEEILVVHFVHEPVYWQSFGVFIFSGREVKFKTTFYPSGQICKNELL